MSSDQAVFVLVRGLLREARHWGSFRDILQQEYPASQILTPDIPGNGCLHRLTSPDSISEMTDSLRQQIPEHKQLVLIGISMGGMIALDWSQRYPAEVHCAIIINSSLRKVAPFYKRLRWQVYPTVIKMLMLSGAARQRVILNLTSNRYIDNPKLLYSWQRWQRQYPISLASIKNQLLAAAGFSLCTRPPQPILIVSSKADRLVDYRCSLYLQHLWHTDYQHHNSAGHDIALDEPVWLVHIIQHWLKHKFIETSQYDQAC